MRILGIDLGERHVGVAVWDDPDLPARPLTTLEVNAATMVGRIAECARQEGATELVVGLPLRLDGREGASSRRARRVAREVAAETKLPVRLQDERLSTAQAQSERVLAGRKGRAGIDARAAAIVLQTYVDARGGPWRPGDPNED